MHRLPVRAAAVLLVAGLLLGALPPGAGGARPASAATEVTFGAYSQPRSGESYQQAVQRLEGAIGRQLGAVRVYDLWDQPFPDSYNLWLRDTGRPMFLSVKPMRTDGTRILWRDIAQAQPGSALHGEIVAWARRVRDFGAPLSFTFHHEPEAAANLDHGTADDFIAAWRTVVDVFRQEGVTNASYVWIMTDYSFWVKDRREARLWYPGDEYVDAIGADAYNWHNCRTGVTSPWKSLAQIIEPLRQFGLLHPSERLVLPEWGTVEDPAVPGRKAQWFADAQALFKSPGWEQFDAVLYFDKAAACRWLVDTSATSLTAFSAMGGDGFYGGGAPPAGVFSDGFDGGFGGWKTVVNLTLDATRAPPGGTTPSARVAVDAKAAYASRALGTTYPGLCVRGEVNLTSVGANSVDLLKLRTAGGTSIGRVLVTSSGTLNVRADVAGRTFTTGRVLALDDWTTVELCGTVGTAGTWTLSVDGARVGSWTADNGSTPIGVVQIGDNVAKTVTLNLDDIRAAVP